MLAVDAASSAVEQLSQAGAFIAGMTLGALFVVLALRALRGKDE